jgi:iron complex transport system substrate-binding protein
VALAVFAFIPGVASEERIRVVDSQGNVISLAQPAQRLVALAPHLVENIFSAGAGTKLVGTVGYSDFPAAAQSLPVVGDFGTFSVERIAQLQPDLILMWGSGNGQAAWERLQTLGIPVYVDEVRSLKDLPASLRNIGTLTGTQRSAERAARTFEQDVETLRLEYSRKSEVSVFYQIWHEPLQTLNGDHLMNQVLSLCGGNNIFADTAGLAPVINIESVLVADPSAIIASGANASRPDWLDRWQNYPTLTAVQNDQIYYIDPDLIQRPTLRLATGAKLLCQQLDTARAHLAD